MMKKVKKKFRRQCFWKKSLGEKWRKPRGRQSKLAHEKKGRWEIPKIGYGNPREVEHTIEFRNERKIPFMIKNMKDLEKITKDQFGVISSSVGKKKAIEILTKAHAMGIVIINRKLKTLKKPLKKPEQKTEKKTEAKPEKK